MDSMVDVNLMDKCGQESATKPTKVITVVATTGTLIYLRTLLLTVMSTNPIFYCNRIDTSNTHSKISSSACCLRKKRKKCDEPVELIVWRL